MRMRRQHLSRTVTGLLALVVVVLLAGFRAREDATTTIYLVRHAEKAAAPADDPALDALGQARARALAHSLENAGIDRVVVTQYRRTGLTAAPLAGAAGVTPIVVDTRMGGAAHAKVVADSARAVRGASVLVVGHSNTIPLIVRELGGTAEPLTDDDYDDLFVVLIPPSGPVRTVHARYGAPHSSH
jgi:broad specificity phosphatase PhoE